MIYHTRHIYSTRLRKSNWLSCTY